MRQTYLIRFIKQRVCGYAWVYPDSNGVDTFTVFDHTWDAFDFGNKVLEIPYAELDLLRISLDDKKNKVALFNSKKEFLHCTKGRTK